MRVVSAFKRIASGAFLKIAEPRVIRTVVFVAYVSFTVLGCAYLVDLPTSFEGVLGTVVAVVFGAFLAGGGLLGAVGILPAWWGLERAGIAMLWTALAEFLIVAAGLGASTPTVAIAVCLALLLLNRWLQESDHQRRRAVQ